MALEWPPTLANLATRKQRAHTSAYGRPVATLVGSWGRFSHQLRQGLQARARLPQNFYAARRQKLVPLTSPANYPCRQCFENGKNNMKNYDKPGDIFQLVSISVSVVDDLMMRRTGSGWPFEFTIGLRPDAKFPLCDTRLGLNARCPIRICSPWFFMSVMPV